MGSILQVAGFVPFVLFDVSFLTALINVVLFGIGAGIGQQSLFQLWSGELFPTLLRSTAQGFMFGVVRIALGGWSLLLPTVQQAGLPHARDRARADADRLRRDRDRVRADRAARELHDDESEGGRFERSSAAHAEA